MQCFSVSVQENSKTASSRTQRHQHPFERISRPQKVRDPACVTRRPTSRAFNHNRTAAVSYSRLGYSTGGTQQTANATASWLGEQPYDILPGRRTVFTRSQIWLIQRGHWASLECPRILQDRSSHVLCHIVPKSSVNIAQGERCTGTHPFPQRSLALVSQPMAATFPGYDAGWREQQSPGRSLGLLTADSQVGVIL